MKNFGLQRLYLVSPSCDMRAASVYASHGADILKDAEVVTLAKVRKAHDLLLATTAIKARRGANVGRTTVKPEEVVARVVAAEGLSVAEPWKVAPIRSGGQELPRILAPVARPFSLLSPAVVRFDLVGSSAVDYHAVID